MQTTVNQCAQYVFRCIPVYRALFPLRYSGHKRVSNATHITALILFFAGLVDFVWALNHVVAAFVIVFIAIPLIFIALTTTLPGLQGIFISLPIRDCRRTVPAQCPFKSTQSLVFRRCVTYSGSVFYGCIRFLSWFQYVTPSHIFRRRSESHDKFKFLATERHWHEFTVLLVWSNSSWLSFDEKYTKLCDSYAYNIMKKEPCIDYGSSSGFRHTGPVFHVIQGINNSFSSYLDAGRTQQDVVAGYKSIKEVLDDASRSTLPEATAMAQKISFSPNDLTNDLEWRSYLSPFIDLPSSLIYEEILLEFLDRCRPLPEGILPHLEELHVRLINFLACHPKLELSTKSPVRLLYSQIAPNHDIHESIREYATYSLLFSKLMM